MIPSIDLETVRFDQPMYLWLLVAPALLLILWAWQFARRRGDAHRLARHRRLPVRERFHLVGALLFWLCLILATTSTIVALARPFARVSLVRRAGIDLVVLQDGSASMHVADVPRGNRWQRSMRFLRVLGEALSWQEDRIALALFAHIATPQIRLTRDPNTYFFFLDHLDHGSPFRLEDDTSWDTNIERGIYWGMRVIEKDEELYGKNPNAKSFVLISDGQAWSGEVAKALTRARQRDIPVFVVGVGSTAGGLIPEPPRLDQSEEDAVPIYSVLDRTSLGVIATAGSGYYFELDRDADREIAASIVEAARSRAGTRGIEESSEDLYWRFLLVAAGFLLVGAVFLREPAELWIQITGAAFAFLLIARLLR